MKKILIHLLKPLSFLPAILMMYLIYSFSAQTGEVSGALSYEVSYQIVETKNEVLNENKTYDELAYSASSIEFYVRKAAHMTEYCLLAIAISFPLYVYGVRGISVSYTHLFSDLAADVLPAAASFPVFSSAAGAGAALSSSVESLACFSTLATS